MDPMHVFKVNLYCKLLKQKKNNVRLLFLSWNSEKCLKRPILDTKVQFSLFGTIRHTFDWVEWLKKIMFFDKYSNLAQADLGIFQNFGSKV